MLTSRAKSKHAYLKTHPSLLQKWVVSSQYNFLTSQRLISHTAGSWEVEKGLPANLRAECPEVWLRLPSWGSSLLGMCTRAVTGAFGNFPNLPVGEKSCSSYLMLHLWISPSLSIIWRRFCALISTNLPALSIPLAYKTPAKVRAAVRKKFYPNREML